MDRTGLGSCPVLGFGSVSAKPSGSAVKISAFCLCVVSFVKCVGKGKDQPITRHEGLEVPNRGYG